MFANGVRDKGSISGWVIPKIKQIVLDASLINTQRYKVRINRYMEQSRKRGSGILFSFV